MPTGIYYKITDSLGGSLYFIPNGYSETSTRDIWEMGIPFVNLKWLMDQITTSVEATQEAVVKPGTGRPYADMNAAIAAIRSLMPATKTTGWVLQGGDWDGSSWVYNGSYPEFGTGDSKIINGNVTFKLPTGENYENGDISVTIQMKFGVIF